jgi:hypothetical protein
MDGNSPCIACEATLGDYKHSTAVRTCRECDKSLPATAFSASQWLKGPKIGKCKDCVTAFQAFEMGTLHRSCRTCNISLLSTEYTYNQWKLGRTKSSCKQCGIARKDYCQGDVSRECAACGRNRESFAFTETEWLKGDKVSRCKKCKGEDGGRGCIIYDDNNVAIGSLPKRRSMHETCTVTTCHNRLECKVGQWPTESTDTERACRTCCKELQPKLGYTFAQWRLGAGFSECHLCLEQTVSYHQDGSRECATCHANLRAKVDYTLSEWRKDEGSSRCRSCIAQLSTTTTTTTNSAILAKGAAGTSISNHPGGATDGGASRVCCSCTKVLRLREFSKPQLKKGESKSTCKACLFAPVAKT